MSKKVALFDILVPARDDQPAEEILAGEAVPSKYTKEAKGWEARGLIGDIDPKLAKAVDEAEAELQEAQDNLRKAQLEKAKAEAEADEAEEEAAKGEGQDETPAQKTQRTTAKSSAAKKAAQK